MPERPNMLEQLRVGVRNGWNRLTRFVDRVRSGEFIEEKKIEIRVIKELLTDRDEKGNVVPDTRNFFQRLRDTASGAAELVRVGFNTIRNRVEVGMDRLRQRCEDEGVPAAVMNITSEALQAVAELPSRLGERLNIFKVGFELAKADMVDTVMTEVISPDNVVEVDEGEGIAIFPSTEALDRFDLLDNVRSYALEKATFFNDRIIRCQERLKKMQEGRERFVQARSTFVLQGIPVAE